MPFDYNLILTDERQHVNRTSAVAVVDHFDHQVRVSTSGTTEQDRLRAVFRAGLTCGCRAAVRAGVRD